VTGSRPRITASLLAPSYFPQLFIAGVVTISLCHFRTDLSSFDHQRLCQAHPHELLFPVLAEGHPACPKAANRPCPRVHKVMELCQGSFVSLFSLSFFLSLSSQNTLMYPDERQLSRGIKATDVPRHLQSMVDALVAESARTEEGYVAPVLAWSSSIQQSAFP
jgi:hypothetical protein